MNTQHNSPWKYIKRGKKLPEHGTFCLVTREWPDSENTVDYAILVVYKRKKHWVSAHGRYLYESGRIGEMFAYDNVVAYIEVPEPAKGIEYE